MSEGHVKPIQSNIRVIFKANDVCLHLLSCRISWKYETRVCTGSPEHNKNFEMNISNKYLLLIMFRKYLHLHSQDMKN